MTSLSTTPRSELIFWLNGRRINVKDAQPRMTLIEYLRSVQLLTGTKLGCGEGGCGACTITVSRSEQGVVVHRAVNACLAPLCSVDACHVTTVEGIGTQAHPHPVQERISSCHGSQCGFCTPGIVMALYSKLQSNPTPTVADIEETFDGNLCRCTGYRPIIDAAKSFASNSESDCPTSNGVVPTALDQNNETGDEKIDVITTSRSKLERTSSTNGNPDCLPPSPPFPPECVELSRQPLCLSEGGITWHRPSTLTSLLELKKKFPKARMITGNTEVGIETRFKNLEYVTLIHTIGVPELNELTSDEDGTVHVGGAVTLAQLEHHLASMLLGNPDSSASHSHHGNVIAMADMLRWFASSQIRNVASLAGNLCTASPISDMNPILLAANAQVDVVSLDGGQRTIPLNNFFIGYRKIALTEEEIVVMIHVPGTQTNEYVRAYKQAKRRDDDISIANACFRCQIDSTSKNLMIGMSTGFGGMAATTVSSKSIEKLFSNGTKLSLQTLKDQEETSTMIINALTEDLLLSPTVPGGMAAYRTTLVLSFASKFLAHVVSCLNEGNGGVVQGMDERDISVSETFLASKRPVTSGVQSYQYDPHGGGLQHAKQEEPHVAQTNETTSVVSGTGKKASVRGPIGQSVRHRSALIQCTGEAVYVDDMPSPPKTMHGAFVLSGRPNGKLLNLDASDALIFLNNNLVSPNDVCAFYQASDISKSQNTMGPINHDEELFREEYVTATGQQLGLIVGSTAELARRAALMVKVTYDDNDDEKKKKSSSEESKGAAAGGGGGGGGSESKSSSSDPRTRLGVGSPIISIDDAVREGTIDMTRHVIVDGSIEETFGRDDVVVVEGTLRVGGQEHFYLECNSALAVPGDGNTEMTVYASTQTTTKTQKYAAQVTGLPECRVVCRMKRMGGAFGGKETRSVFVSTGAALAASRCVFFFFLFCFLFVLTTPFLFPLVLFFFLFSFFFFLFLLTHALTLTLLLSLSHIFSLTLSFQTWSSSSN